MSSDQIGHPLIEPVCYLSMLTLTVANIFTDKIPIHLSICVYSLAIIIIGSYRSLREMIGQMKKVHINGQKSEGIETLSNKDALQFPLFAGATLLFLYLLIKFFGKESVNYFVLAYIALGSTTGIKALIQSFTGTMFDKIDEGKIINIKNSYIELEVSLLDLICFALSIVSVIIYSVSKSWVYNNAIAILFCIHALQLIFLGNFKTGGLLLVLLFFYDIFFVFGTDVMLTVAKNIDAPIKLQFPKDMSVTPPQYSILGLGDIVIPGIFMSMCLRFDFLKTLDKHRLSELIESERKGTTENNKFVGYLIAKANAAPKSYFIAVIIGYLVAILTTVVIMIIFDHGQPALLYLVPGCLISVAALAIYNDDKNIVWNHSEEPYLSNEKKDN
ncbi:signal peptide peptidase family protein [Stylonychia lemnae]|uniref:Signal peptide peptidase family protein n=1 Tax=Stylonychia lemnae TaxID=5949 RepID=A0A078B498_STYLE|nr:signal peptide peptidase family protein [Stylonychia lemnae]|eukprot:CDW88328.1 signal peptide peptidase family protein [Stylonychia lemnae]